MGAAASPHPGRFTVIFLGMTNQEFKQAHFGEISTKSSAQKHPRIVIRRIQRSIGAWCQGAPSRYTIIFFSGKNNSEFGHILDNFLPNSEVSEL